MNKTNKKLIKYKDTIDLLKNAGAIERIRQDMGLNGLKYVIGWRIMILVIMVWMSMLIEAEGKE